MAVTQLNVTQLTRACVDESWRSKWIAGEQPSSKSFAPPGVPKVYGQLFHGLAARLVSWLTTDRHAAELEKGGDIWAELYERFAGTELAKLADKGELQGAHSLSERLKALCSRVADLRKRAPSSASWSDVFLATEYSASDIEFRRGENVLLLSGKVDGLRFHPRHHLEIVDYKLSQGAHQKQDMVQVALYAALLARAKPGLSFCGTVEYYLPGLKTVEMRPEELDCIFDSVVWPVVEELGGGARSPHREPGTREAARSPEAAPKQPVATDNRGRQIEECFAAFKLEVEVTGRQEAPQVVRYTARPAPGVKVVSLANRSEDVQVALALEVPPLITPGPGHVNIDLPRQRPLPVHWRDVVRERAYRSHPGSVSFPVGVGVDGRLVIADLADANTAHGLVAGVSGSGKSEFLRSAVAALMDRNPPEMLQLSVVDPKILSFTAMEGSRHLNEPLITDLPGALRCLTAAVSEMERRYRVLAGEGLQGLGQRIAAGRTDIPYRVIVFDEFAELVLASKEGKKEFEALVARVAAKGRAAGIHLILATQRPDREIVTGLIKANLPLRVCLKVTSATNSQIILDQPGADKLLGRGDLLCDLGKGPVRAQSPLITEEELRGLVA